MIGSKFYQILKLVKIQGKAKTPVPLLILDEIWRKGQINVTPSWQSDQALMIGWLLSQGAAIRQNCPQTTNK